MRCRSVQNKLKIRSILLRFLIFTDLFPKTEPVSPKKRSGRAKAKLNLQSIIKLQNLGLLTEELRLEGLTDARSRVFQVSAGVGIDIVIVTAQHGGDLFVELL